MTKHERAEFLYKVAERMLNLRGQKDLYEMFYWEMLYSDTRLTHESLDDMEERLARYINDKDRKDDC